VTTLVVPPFDEKPWPTLGPLMRDFIEERCIFGPGSLKGQPAILSPEKLAVLYRMYEVYPQGHPFAGRRRFKRCAISWRKGTAKTEFAAWIAFAELHPEGPVRADGFDAAGNPVGVPVRDPYIPMVAYTQEQVEELAYGALYTVVTEGPDADYFDAGLDRIIRLDVRGRADGRAVALAGSPNARDGARTTFQHFDEPHRMHLPNLLAAHETMMGNLPKRPLEDPWSLETTTAGQPGQGSVAEKTHNEGLKISRGEVEEPDLFYFHRYADTGHDLSTLEGRIAAVAEATGAEGEYGPGQFRDIAKQWDRDGADHSYLERVWLNRWTRSASQAFDVKRWKALCEPALSIPAGAFVTAGFDGARFKDSTGIVVTDIHSGRQELWAGWEKPSIDDEDPDAPRWECPEDEVTDAMDRLHERFEVWQAWCDPPHWTETVGSWAVRHPDSVIEWWTARKTPMAYAVRAYREAIASAAITPVGYRLEDFTRHIGNAGRHDLNLEDDDGKPLFVLRKLHLDRKFDFAMAGCLSWAARLEALRKNAQPAPKATGFVPRRIR
jgi:hypothetical protein